MIWDSLMDFKQILKNTFGLNKIKVYQVTLDFRKSYKTVILQNDVTIIT